MHKSAALMILATLVAIRGVHACCPVAPRGVPAVNADQTVILIWDREHQTEHFIRQASFRSGGDSVGFLVPTPSRPQVEESGDEAFPYLAQVTAPKEPLHIEWVPSCAARPNAGYGSGVRVVEEKTVAGYHVVVLAADSGKALVAWLGDHGYAYTPEVAAWAQPYLAARWYITAMKLAKDLEGGPRSELTASALRLSFRTDRPLFPYREPDSRKDAASFYVVDRLLRIYLVAESRYEGRFPSGAAWSGQTRWSQPLAADQRSELLRLLGLPASTGPAKAWLTLFEDRWPYGQAPGDVYFSASSDQRRIARASSRTFDPLLVAVIGICAGRSLWRRKRAAVL